MKEKLPTAKFWVQYKDTCVLLKLRPAESISFIRQYSDGLGHYAYSYNYCTKTKTILCEVKATEGNRVCVITTYVCAVTNLRAYDADHHWRLDQALPCIRAVDGRYELYEELALAFTCPKPPLPHWVRTSKQILY